MYQVRAMAETSYTWRPTKTSNLVLGERIPKQVTCNSQAWPKGMGEELCLRGSTAYTRSNSFLYPTTVGIEAKEG